MTHQIPAPVLRSPHHLVAAVPFLLGFPARSSVVVVWIQSGAITLTQRVDWPSIEVEPNLSSWAADVVRAASHVQAQAAVLLGYPPEQPVDSAHPLAALGRAIERSDTEVLDLLVVLEDGWQVVHMNGEILTGEACILDPRILAEVSDDFMLSGWSFAASREEVCAEFAPCAGAEVTSDQAFGRLLGEVGTLEPAQRESWRDKAIDQLVHAMAGGCVDPGDIAEFAVSLGDIRVRDCVLWQLAWQLDHQNSFLTLRSLIRGTPEGHRAPAATVTAICAWLMGDGVRASAALDIAIGEDPEYGLAQLVATALANGLPPRMWQETMEQLTYDSCRNGLR